MTRRYSEANLLLFVKYHSLRRVALQMSNNNRMRRCLFLVTVFVFGHNTSMVMFTIPTPRLCLCFDSIRP